MLKNRVQLFNPVTKRWVKIDVKHGGVLGYKDTRWSNILTVDEQKKTIEYKNQLVIDNIIATHKFKIDPKYAKRNIKCDCGHSAKSHYLTEGCCNECGCTWYSPNFRWIQKQQIKEAQKLLEDKNTKE